MRKVLSRSKIRRKQRANLSPVGRGVPAEPLTGPQHRLRLSRRLRPTKSAGGFALPRLHSHAVGRGVAAEPLTGPQHRLRLSRRLRPTKSAGGFALPRLHSHAVGRGVAAEPLTGPQHRLPAQPEASPYQVSRRLRPTKVTFTRGRARRRCRAAHRSATPLAAQPEASPYQVSRRLRPTKVTFSRGRARRRCRAAHRSATPLAAQPEASPYQVSRRLRPTKSAGGFALPRLHSHAVGRGVPAEPLTGSQHRLRLSRRLRPTKSAGGFALPSQPEASPYQVSRRLRPTKVAFTRGSARRPCRAAHPFATSLAGSAGGFALPNDTNRAAQPAFGVTVHETEIRPARNLRFPGVKYVPHLTPPGRVRDCQLLCHAIPGRFPLPDSSPCSHPISSTRDRLTTPCRLVREFDDIRL